MNTVLLAEDEPVSRRFLAEALQSLGLGCEAVDDGRHAFRLACERRFDLLLLDINLPRLGGSAILAAVRAEAGAASRAAPALALTADPSPGLQRELLQGGFDAVGTKPLSLATLAVLLGQSLPGFDAPRSPATWDEAAALRASGSPEIVQALRGLLLKDLPGQDARIRDALAQGDIAPAMAELHRLRAACGFCGAVALDRAVQSLAAAIDAGCDTRAALCEFSRQAQVLLLGPG